MNILQEIVQAYKTFGQVFYHFWWIVFPVVFYYLFKFLWMDFVQKAWLQSLSWTLLEVIPPKDLEKGPKPMESIYQGLVGVVVAFNVFEEFLKGVLTDVFSFELVGSGGEAHFYIRTQTKFRNLIEAQVYAQYPDAQVVEVEDYTKNFPKVIPNKNWDLWGSDLELAMPDPYPIRTYDKFEESITGTMIDPIAAFVETMGTLPPGQNIWLQIVTRPLPEKWREDEMKLVQKLAGRISNGEKGFFADLMDVLANLFKAMSGPVEFAKADKKEEQPLEFRLTPGEKDQLKAVEENLGKNAFKIKMRVLYLGRKEGFDKSFVSAFFGALRQFNDLNLNSLKPENQSKTYANFVAVDQRLQMRKRKIYKRYKERDTTGKKFVFSTSELATVWHFPDMGVKTPAVTRVESKKGAAPANLPVQ
ncbi:MAG: hypothetical protein AAB487_01890 [Patescibacteria group bacterium]